MAERPAGPEPPASGGGGAAPNLVSRASQWADDHLRLVRNISTGMAIAGIILFLRSVRLTAKFTSAAAVPAEFIRKRVKLRGRLRRVTDAGLEVEHLPVVAPLLSAWRQEPCGVLLIKLAGVQLTDSGKAWLQRELQPSQHLWFQLLGKENSALFCYLLVKKGGYFSVNLNEEILRRGLGKVVPVTGLDSDSKTYWKIHRKLLKAELRALKKGEGIWKEEYEKETYLAKFRDSWKEIWKKDSSLQSSGSDFNLKTQSYYDKVRSTYDMWKDSVNNFSLVLKFRELKSRLRFRRKG
ncbi:protein C3orf33 homolog [Thomomys bottae]